MKKLGFGTMRLPLTNPADPASIDQEQVNQMADRFLEQDFTYVDTAYMYHSNLSESAVRKAFVERYPRDRFVLADKMPIAFVQTSEDYDCFFNEQLERCGVEYFDYYLLHNVSRRYLDKTEKMGGFEYMKRLKEKGLIRHIGMSYHDTADYLEPILQRHPELEVIQLQLNYADWDNEVIQAGKNYELCVRYGRKVIVMEPVKGGSLARLPAKAQELLHAQSSASDASWAIRFAASCESVFVTLSGMSSLSQMEDNLSFMNDFQPLSEAERKTIDQVVRILREQKAIPCTACRYCVNHEPGCPMNIAIPEYFGIFNTVKEFGQSGSTTLRYRNLKQDGHGAPADCIACGQCEEHCPQHLPIIELISKMHAMDDLSTKLSFELPQI